MKKIKVNYSGTEPIQLWWKLDRGNNFSPDVTTQICDLNLFYSPEVLQNSMTKPNKLPNLDFNGDPINPSEFTIYMNESMNFNSCDTIYLDFFSDKNFTIKVKTIVI